MGTVKFKGTADYAQIKREHDKLHKQFVKIREEMRRTRQEGGRGNKEHSAGLGRITGQLRGVVAQYVGIQQAIQLATKYVADLQQQQQRAREANRSLASVQAGMLTMAGDIGPADALRLEKRVNALTARARPVGGKRTAYEVLETTLSAAGQEDLAFRSAEIGLKLGRKSSAEAVALSGGMLDIAQVTGERKDMMKNAGFLIAATQQARVTSLEATSRYGAQAAKTIVSQGGTPVEAMSLYTAMTKALVDAEGRKAKTAAISVSESLAKFLPTEDLVAWKKDKRGGERQVVTKEGTGLSGARERLEHLWANPEARRRYEAEYVSVMEKGARGGVRAFLAGPGATDPKQLMVVQAYQQAMREIPGVQQAAPYAERKLAAMGAPFPQRVQRAEDAAELAIEQLKTETKLGEKRTVAGIYSVDEMRRVMAAGGVDFWTRQAESVAFRLSGKTNKQFFERVINQQIEKLEHPPHHIGTSARPPTATEQEMANIMRAMLQRMEEQTRVIEKGNQRLVPAGAGMFTEPGAG